MTKASKNETAQSTSPKANGNPKTRGSKPRKTKRAQLIRLLKAKAGADVAEISKMLGWQRHTTRAALTGLRKAGFTIERSAKNGGGGSVYRITAEPNPESGAGQAL